MNKIKSIISDEFNITLTVTNSCNYRCKYCPPNLQNGSEEPILVETYIKFFTNLIEDNPQINDYSERFISITGGEPSLYKGIEELISFLNENNFNVTLDSNGSAPKEVWERLFEKTNNTQLSFHPRYSKFPKFDELIEIGQRKNAMMSIGLLMDPEHWDRVLEAVEHFKQYNIPVSYKGVVARSKSENSVKKGDNLFIGEYSSLYTEEQLKYIKENLYQSFDRGLDGYDPNNVSHTTKIYYENGEVENFQQQKLVSQGLNKFKGFRCEAGKSNLSIKWDGTVTGAHCGANFSGDFGNLIKNKDLKVKLKPIGIICHKSDSCTCGPDMRITKSITKLL
jgi:organic radical activating enzyme